MKLLGAAPEVLGTVNMEATEAMFWLYAQVKRRGDRFTLLPHNLKWVSPMLEDIAAREGEVARLSHNVYVTAKVLWTEGACTGQRPGWHTDGFGTPDINYIWYDRSPTRFWVPPCMTRFSADHRNSMRMMEESALEHPEYILTYPPKTLLRLDERVIHSPQPEVEPGWRAFVKVSLSRSEYDLEMSSTSAGFPEKKRTPRTLERNCPTGRST